MIIAEDDKHRLEAYIQAADGIARIGYAQMKECQEHGIDPHAFNARLRTREGTLHKETPVSLTLAFYCSSP